MTSDEDFDALRCIVNYARSQVRCTLGQARANALAEGFSQEAVDAAVKFWAKHEAEK